MLLWPTHDGRRAGPEHRPRSAQWAVPDLAKDRIGRDGRRLQGGAAGDEPHGGGEDPPPEARQPQRPRVALPPRGAGDEPPDPPEHGEGLPVRRARGRLALHRDGAPRGQEPQSGRPQRGAAAGRAGDPRLDPGLRSAPGGAPPGHRPPRFEAREHLPLDERRAHRTSPRCWTSASPRSPSGRCVPVP